jgi:hypothetical protein
VETGWEKGAHIGLDVLLLLLRIVEDNGLVALLEGDGVSVDEEESREKV